MAYTSWFYVVLLLVVFLILVELRGQRFASNARAIAIHLTGSVVPMLEQRGYRIERKQVSFGRSPYVKFNISSKHGIWIDILVDERRGYFVLSNMQRADDKPMDLTHKFEVSGPWDELTPSRIEQFEQDFQTWKANGCRSGAWQSKPDDHVYYYLPQGCHYVQQGAKTASSPTDPGFRLAQWINKANPDQRYPLVPLLPRA